MFKTFALLAGTIFTAAALSGTTPALADSKTALAEGTQLAMGHGMKGHGKIKKRGQILKRRKIFRCISTGLKRIKKGKGNAKKNARLVLKNAAILHQNLKKLFPRGSHKGMTRAKKKLWKKKNWAKFAKQSAALKAGAARLVKMGGSKKGLKGVYKTCKGSTNRSVVRRKKTPRKLSAANPTA
jgi:cytochrome c556